MENGCYALDQGAAAGYCYGNSARWSPREEMSTLWRSGSKTKFLTLLSGWKIEKWPLVAYSRLACGSMKNAISGLGRNCLFSDLESHLLFSVFCSSRLAYCPLQEEAIQEVNRSERNKRGRGNDVYSFWKCASSPRTVLYPHNTFTFVSQCIFLHIKDEAKAVNHYMHTVKKDLMYG